MTIHDAGWALDDVAAVSTWLRSLPTRPEVLGLGEPTHGEETFPRLRNEIFRHLVEHEGYRSIALESDCLAGLLVDDFIAGDTAEASLDDVMRHGFSHGFGDIAANRELVAWMRDDNRERPAADRLRFVGFDGPLEITAAASPRDALTGLHDFLDAHVTPPHSAEKIHRLLGDDARWTNPDAAWHPEQSVGSAPEVGELRLITDDLTILLATESPQLIAESSYDAWQRARLYARTAAGLLRYHAAMADPAPTRMARLASLRDAMMADNLDAVEERPMLVFAHNRHLQRDRGLLTMGGRELAWWSAGALLEKRLRRGYAVMATTVGAAEEYGLAAAPGTLEGVLSALPGERHLLDGRRLTAAPGVAELVVRPSTDFRYLPLEPEVLPRTDGIVFIRSLPAG